jgi:Ca-activated chloride channel family protein
VTFLVAWRLGLLVVVGAFTGAWLAGIFRRQRDVVRFTDVALLDVVAPVRSPWRRHVPAALWLLALTSLIVGFARPARDVTVEREAATVVIALDTSLSMEADDVDPSRLDAAKAAAVDFVEHLPDHVDAGLVLFSGTLTPYAPVAVEERPALVNTIENAALGEYTAIGDALDRSVELIQQASETAAEGEGDEDSDDEPIPGRVVLMADGENTQGRTPAEAAADAAGAAIAVDTISFGTPEGVIVEDGMSQPVPVAPGPLQEVADTTGGEFYEAASLEGLSSAYDEVTGEYQSETEEREISGWFIGAGLALLVIAGGLSLVWSQRLP